MDSEVNAADKAGAPVSAIPETSGWPLARWYLSSATLNVPQAAGPVAFSLLSLALTGDASGGAAIILAMTLAQVVGAVPLTRVGRNLSSSTVLRLLVGFRTLALALLVLCAVYEASFPWFVVCAALAGSVNGAAYGHLRAVLNQLSSPSRLPRALGIAATLNEVVFVLAPVAASALGVISPVLGIFTLTLIGALPTLLVPAAETTTVETVHRAAGSVLTPQILLWLTCSAAGGAAVAAIEIGAVALAISFGYEPALAIIFTVPLCLASVAGGVWVSVRNRMPRRRSVVFQLSTMTVGAMLAAMNQSLETTVVGAVLIGLVLAPLGTYYSLVLDDLAPAHRRPEVFALLRTANAVGVIFASAVLTVASLASSLIVVAGFMLVVTILVSAVSFRQRAAL